MKEIPYDDMPRGLQELYDEYYKMFGTHPDCYAELDGPCEEAYHPKWIREALDRKLELPDLILGEGYEHSGGYFG